MKAQSATRKGGYSSATNAPFVLQNENPLPHEGTIRDSQTESSPDVTTTPFAIPNREITVDAPV